MLELKDITKEYQGPSGAPVHVLKGVSLEMVAGDSLAVVGPSGAGKSTLLNIMGALDRPSSGVVRLAGRDLAQMCEEELAEVRRREIGFVFQLHHLLPQCNVLENVLVPVLADSPRIDEKTLQLAVRLLDRVGLGDRAEHRPAELSGGELQRTAVVRSLINRPKVVLADEPTGSLDGKLAEELGDLLVEVNKEEGVTLVVVTHSTSLASRLGRQLALSDGVFAEL